MMTLTHQERRVLVSALTSYTNRKNERVRELLNSSQPREVIGIEVRETREDADTADKLAVFFAQIKVNA